nr:MAG TPA: hypothetical protein [Caudoviricetes sp.]DAL74786.1 MAG TPA: hypothetical protein [Caudoviricetes sp.]
MSHSAEKTAEPTDCLDSIKGGQSITPFLSVRFIGLRLWYSRREHQQKHQVHEQGAEELCSEVFDLRSPT